MTYQTTIPAEKVRELAAKYDGDSSGDPERLLADLLHDLHGLSAPPQPTTGLLGRWAKHPEHGDVVCMWDKPSRFGKMRVAHVSEGKTSGAEHWYAEFDSLTFPHQTTRPEDVPAGEAWLVDVNEGEQSLQSVVAIKGLNKMWLTLERATGVTWCSNGIITLICPLTPERPGKGDEQPVWRIEHDWRNIRVGEYIIDSDDDTGTVTRLDGHGHRDTDGTAYGFPGCAPFIAFTNVDAATPEAIAEAKRARDKEMGK